jgi:hypothetical protein
MALLPSSPPHISPYRDVHSVAPLSWFLLFGPPGLRARSAGAAKTTPTLRPSASGPGHGLSRAGGFCSPLSRIRATLPPYRAARPVRGSFSPDGGNRGGTVVAPPASPLKPGKNKGLPRESVSGLLFRGHGRLSSGHIRPVSYRVSQEVYLCITNNPYSMLRVSRKRHPSPSAASPGH